VTGDGSGVGVGDQVRTSSGATGEVIEIRRDGKVVVRAGSMKMTLPSDQVSRIPSPATHPSPAARVSSRDPRPTTHDTTEIDLRGLTGDEAESVTHAALDAAVLGEAPFLRIIHGMGTGVVRERVQRVLKADRRVRAFAFAPRNQGGTGVTVAEFSA
jgi:DNA mismatch repair protein MutS2